MDQGSILATIARMSYVHAKPPGFSKLNADVSGIGAVDIQKCRGNSYLFCGNPK
jgi:hypothetical protein